jgi:hypothetical protein
LKKFIAILLVLALALPSYSDIVPVGTVVTPSTGSGSTVLSTTPSFTTSIVGDLTSGSSGSFTISGTGYGASGAGINLLGRNASGTKGSETATVADNFLVQISARGYDGSAFSSASRGRIVIKAGETFTSTTQGTYITLETAQNGATTQRVRAVVNGTSNTDATFTVGTGELSATPGSQIIKATGGTGTNIAGAPLIIYSGISTGSATPSLLRFNGTALGGSSGTTAQTNVDRMFLNATKALTDASVTNLANATVANNSAIGGQLCYNIEATDGTDYQSETGCVIFSAVNKAGTVTRTINEINSQQAVSGGTLTTTWAISNANPAVVSVNADTDLTPSSGFPRITYRLENYGQQAVAIQ